MIKKHLYRIIEYPLVVAFSGMILAVFVCFLVMPDVEFSQYENRYLAKMPEISISALSDGSFMSGFETYSNEQLPFRDELIKIKAVSETILGKCENNNIVKGKNGYLFDKTLTTSQQLHKNISAISNFVKANNDRTVYVAVAPTSTLVYEEYLPAGLPVLDERQAEAELHKELDEYDNAIIVDITSGFAGRENEQLYYKTDHHWTTKGAYYAYVAIANRMGYAPVDYDDCNISRVDDFYGTYYAKYKGVGIEPDSIEYPEVAIKSYSADSVAYDSIYDMSKQSVYDKYAMFMYGNPGIGEVISKADNGKSLIIIKNSYANCMIPFLTYNYEKIITIDPRYYGESIASLINEHKDSDILLLYDWSFINEDNHFYKIVK